MTKISVSGIIFSRDPKIKVLPNALNKTGIILVNLRFFGSWVSNNPFSNLLKRGTTFLDLQSGLSSHKSSCCKGFLKPLQIIGVNQLNVVLVKNDEFISGLDFCAF